MPLDLHHYGKKSNVTFVTDEGETKRESQTIVRDESLEDSANLPAPDVLAQEIIDDLEAALEQIKGVLGGLEG
jgi:hypothetical protein